MGKRLRIFIGIVNGSYKSECLMTDLSIDALPIFLVQYSYILTFSNKQRYLLVFYLLKGKFKNLLF